MKEKGCHAEGKIVLVVSAGNWTSADA